MWRKIGRKLKNNTYFDCDDFIAEELLDATTNQLHSVFKLYNRFRPLISERDTKRGAHESLV